jgi:eukaryotic-like serine/threonine-protein kinase
MAGSGMTRFQSGDRIGLYVIDCELASDTTGITYRAVHQVLPRRSIVKVMHAASVYPPVIKQPLAVHVLREACILEALHHPGVIRLYESGMLPDRRPWFARELVEGASVGTVLSPGSIDRMDAIALLRDVSDVLDHAYRRGIIHCGLRPDRIVLTGRSRGYPICITEWGDARAHDAAPLGPYAPSPASWHYTSPELACGDPIDDRTDVFALGVIAYQLFTGHLPFDGEGIAMMHDGSTQHVPTEVRCPDVPRELTHLVDTMLAYDRWDRPAMAEVHGDLAWLADVLATPVTRPRQIVRIRQPRWTPNVVDVQRPLTDRSFEELLGDEAPKSEH